MKRITSLHCWGGCEQRRPYPDMFPERNWAVCWYCTPFEVRVRLPEWRVPKQFRWWRSTSTYTPSRTWYEPEELS